MAPASQESDALEKSLKDLKLTNEEMNKFEKAFKDPEFLRLFEEYAKEVSDPKVKAETDQYLRQLEQQGREEDVYGKGVQLVVPTAAMVLKTKVLGPAANTGASSGAAASNGSGKEDASLPVGQKVFINICTSDKVARYSLEAAKDASGRVGKKLSIPLTLGPKREGKDKQGQPAAVYDFVVHPDSVEFAAGNAAAMASLADTALEQVESVSRSRLSRQWRRLSSRFKATEGCTEPPVQCIRTSAEGGEVVDGRLRPRPDVPGVNVPGQPTPASAAGVPGAAGGEPSAAASGASGAEAAKDAVEGGMGGGGGAAAGAASGAAGSGGGRSGFSFDRTKSKQAAAAQQQQKQPEMKDPSQPGYRHSDGCLTPEWSLVHRGEADLAAAWGDAGRGLALGASVPKELLVRVTLPEVTSAAAVDLDVGPRKITLKVPGRYFLDAPLPYTVYDSKGKARFDKARKQLEVTLPVIPPPPPPRPVAVTPPVLAEQPVQAEAEESRRPEAEAEATQPVSQGEGAAVTGEGSLGECTAGSGSGSGQKTNACSTASGTSAGGSDGEGLGSASSLGAEAAVERTAQQPSEQAAGAGTPHPSSQQGRELSENERKWLELHHRQQQQEQQQAEGEAAVAVAADMVPSSSSAGTAATAVASGDGNGGAGGVEALAPPTVMLAPRLRRELAMELD